MRREGRLAATIDILDTIVAEAQDDGATVNNVLREYFASRRYAGSGDRRTIGDGVFQILRQAVLLGWALEEAEFEVTGRNLVIVEGEWEGRDLPQLFGSGRYAPPALTDDERGMIWALPDRDEAPDWAVLNCPRWMAEPLKARFGEGFAEEMSAMADRAPFTMRVNSLKATTDAVEAELRADEIKFRRSHKTPGAIHAATKRIKDTQIYQQGWVEIQDSSSQIASYLTCVEPHHRVLDLCAGAGGKSLAMAALMENRGEIHACDIYEYKNKELKMRAQRAGVDIIQPLVFPKNVPGVRDIFMQAMANNMDRVVIDAPCSGSGTWRRAPELRLRMTENRVKGLLDIQKELLDEGVGCVKADGWLIYMTCSLLPQENEHQINAFLERHPGWEVVDYRLAWGRSKIPSGPRVSRSMLPGCLQLTPKSHGTDGFFVAILKPPAGH